MSNRNIDEIDEEDFESFALNLEDVVKVIDLDDDDPHPDSDDEDNDGMEVDGESAAATGIVADVDDAGVVFKEHKDSVFCVRVDPITCTLAVTGGQDDKALVWDIETGQVVFECTGHKDSVTSVGWSHDSVYVATADLSGLIKVWKVESKEEVWSFEAGDVEWLQWHHDAHVLLVGTVDGQVWMWKIPGGDCKTFSSHGPGALSGVVMPDGKRAGVGYEDGVIKIWDLKTGDCQHTITGNDGHNSSVVSLHSSKDNSLLMSGSTDMTAKLINTTTGKVISTYDCSSHRIGSADDENSVESVGLSGVLNYAATGTLGGVMSIWDISTHVVRHQCVHGDGIVKLKWDETSPLVYTASLDGVVSMWDARSGKEETRWTGHSAAILDFDITEDGDKLLTVCEDHTARVFSIKSPDG
ncbi:LOW QUALITY PROTEIN: angio-associated migratory cell protein-like [Haliotis rubra]|uniref:LOW QUALITY PROTEIN: angio-associated migratory cell protein-like n=1 Tax=Haliotis rubra TaxID=36100 RepID=UPI001EE51C4E|nr:LOW QUALITY PROTEIN: angio-associated migratory cell protein-like [Haliotis rubra]